MKQKITIKNMFAYIQGNIRYQLYYSKFNWLIRKHIREQIDCRIKSMNKQCFVQGSCIMCGCRTTALQMADKSCDNPCYPAMLSKSEWKFLKKGNVLVITNTEGYYSRMKNFQKDIKTGNYIKWKLENKKFIQV